MTYQKLNDSAKKNAIVNYCNIMNIPIEIYKDKIIDWLVKFKIDVLDENGKFIHAGDKNIVGF